jgi:hypothetical protein
VAAGILESKTALGGMDEERMDVDEENVHALSPLSHHLSRSMVLYGLRYEIAYLTRGRGRAADWWSS